MANGNESSADKDMIAVRLGALLEPLCDQIANLCQCIKDYAPSPSAMPCGAFPLFFKGSIVQNLLCHQATSAMQVPKGMTATITRISVTERYPMTLFGANIIIVINDNMLPNMPRVDHSVGSIQTSDGLKVCLAEQDIISIMLQCSWQPVVFSGQSSTYVQTLFPFQLEGYMEFQEIPLSQ